MTLFPRSSGVLLHPTSLPGRYGIGDLGQHAYDFADWLEAQSQTVWQVLPLGPTSYGDSPYQCLSAFAGNTNLISLDQLVEAGWLTKADLAYVPDFPVHYVDYGPVIEYHNKMLDLAYRDYSKNATKQQLTDYDAWYEQNQFWLDDYALFVAIKDENKGRPWVEWDEALIQRDPRALDAARIRLVDEINKHRFLQWVFFSQWSALKSYVNEKGIRLVGDLPIFVAHDSSDVWANQDAYYLEKSGQPTVVAGVPPDYFSETGQRWGNPLYRWDIMRAHSYKWWIARIQSILGLVNMIRIDHFRGFEAYWEIPASEPTAIKGQWVKGPNIDFFHMLDDALGALPIIAEDLGEITKEVVELRDTLGLPGMKILQFAWSDPQNPFLPHNYVNNCVVYSGTHDNNTTLGWWMANELGDGGKQFMQQYLDTDAINEPHWILIRMGMASAAHTFIAPLQDILGYGGDTRMNTPGTVSGNWTWRFTADKLDDPAKDRLAHLTWLYKRRPDQQGEVYGDVAKQED